LSALETILQVENLGHRYASGGKSLEVLREVNLEIRATQLVAVQGESGCGKTTLLLACGAMQKPTAGRVKIDQQNVYELSTSARSQFRARKIGYLFQTLQLIPYLTLLNNIRIVQGVSSETAKQWLDRLGLADRMHHKPEALSHGQRQRAALARAIAHQPALVIADEPTGNLDEKHSQMVFETLREFANNGGAVLIATHDAQIPSYADQVHRIESGTLQMAEVPA
jgi:putative ABC transport system ATP-binding protein